MKISQMKTSHFDKKNLIAPIIIVILLSLAVGLMIFYVTNPLFNKEVEEPYVKELALTDKNVRILYNYVSYSIGERKNDVFAMNENLTKENMKDEDKLYCALQFSNPSDFVSTGKRDEEDNQIFNIPDSKIDEYMKKFFGNNIKYSKVKKLKLELDLGNEQNYVGKLTYNNEEKGYDTILEKRDEEDEKYFPSFYTKLVKAQLYEDKTIELQEKVIYTKVSKKNDLYTIKVYGDIHYNNEIETRNNLTESQMENSVYNMNEYINEASTITYTFKPENDIYYFYSSVITNK